MRRCHPSLSPAVWEGTPACPIPPTFKPLGFLSRGCQCGGGPHGHGCCVPEGEPREALAASCLLCSFFLSPVLQRSELETD